MLRGTEKVVEAFDGESAAIKSLGGHPNTRILGDTFYAMVPLLSGRNFGKISVAPVAPMLTALKDQPIKVSGRPDVLRDEVRKYFRGNSGVWKIRMQLCTDLDTMPIEDASVVWPEDQGPDRTVARITVPKQDSWNEGRDKEQDELLFSLWHGVAARRPLSGIVRSHRQAYPELSALRSKINDCPLHEPREQVSLPG